MRAAAGNGPQRFGETGKQVQGGCSFMRFLHKPTLQSSEPTGLTLAVVMSCGLLQLCFDVADMREMRVTTSVGSEATEAAGEPRALCLVFSTNQLAGGVRILSENKPYGLRRLR